VYWVNGRPKMDFHRYPGRAGSNRSIIARIKPTLDCPRIMKLQDLKEKILQYANLNNKKGTFDLFKISFMRFIACVGNKPTRVLTALDIEQFKEHLIREVSKVTANDYLRSLKTHLTLDFA